MMRGRNLSSRVKFSVVFRWKISKNIAVSNYMQGGDSGFCITQPLKPVERPISLHYFRNADVGTKIYSYM
jgi:hypothetical protein